MSWRRATAPPFNDLSFSFAGTNPVPAATVAESAQSNMFRRRLESAVKQSSGRPQYAVAAAATTGQIYDVASPQLAPAAGSNGVVRSPRGVHFSAQPQPAPMPMLNTVPAPAPAPATRSAADQPFFVTAQAAPSSSPQQLPPQRAPSSSATATAAAADVESRAALHAVAHAIDSARHERDSARYGAFLKELEVLGLRREASDAANLVLSSHRQFMMADNTKRAAEAQLSHLQQQLDAEVRHNEQQLRRAAALMQSRDEQWQARVAAERDGAAALEAAVAERDREIAQLREQLAAEREQSQALRHQLANRAGALEDIEQQLSAVNLQRGELSAFYEKTVRDYEARLQAAERRASEQLVAAQADHALQRVRMEEQVTRSGIAEESAKQALQVIHARLALLGSRYSDRAFEREQQAAEFAEALDELRAASASALAAIQEERAHDIAAAFQNSARNAQPPVQQQQQQQQNLFGAADAAIDSQAGELRRQVARLQAALESVTDERNTFLKELQQGKQAQPQPQHQQRHSEAVRREVAKEVSARAIEDAVETRHSARKQRAERQEQEEQEARRRREFSDSEQHQPHHVPRVGSIAARMTVHSVRGLQCHPELASRDVKVCALIFGPAGQQLCDIDCDEEAIAVAPASFGAQTFHFVRGEEAEDAAAEAEMDQQQQEAPPQVRRSNGGSGRGKRDKHCSVFPLTLYLHPADPGVAVVHIWARVDGDMTVPRKFLGCATLQIRDILRRGPGIRVLRLHGREPHEQDPFVRAAAASSSSSSGATKKGSSGLGFVTVEIDGPFSAVHDAPPLQNEALSPQEEEAQRAAQLRSRHRGPGAAVLAALGGAEGAAASLLEQHQRQQQQQAQLTQQQQRRPPRHDALVLPSNVPPLGAKSGAADTAEVWIRAVSFVRAASLSFARGSQPRLFARLTNEATGSVVLRTPVMHFDGDDGSSFWPKTDACVALSVAGRDALFRFELFEARASSAASPLNSAAGGGGLGGSRTATVLYSASDTDAEQPGTGNTSQRDVHLIGSAVLSGADLVAEVQGPDASLRRFGGPQSTRVSVSLDLRQRQQDEDASAVLELVLRIY